MYLNINNEKFKISLVEMIDEDINGGLCRVVITPKPSDIYTNYKDGIIVDNILNVELLNNVSFFNENFTIIKFLNSDILKMVREKNVTNKKFK